jgi:hypothetical protein
MRKTKMFPNIHYAFGTAVEIKCVVKKQCKKRFWGCDYKNVR